MRIGIIGLGDIARKAYLPVITARNDVELIFCTRNTATLEQLASVYRISETVTEVRELISRGIRAAFVHSSTESHAEITKQLLQSGIHVYVDKPIAYTYEESLELTELAEKNGLILMVGFNRRFAPLYVSAKEKSSPNLILMQKNRPHSPDFARRFILDDFIHVVDTLRYLVPGAVRDINVTSHQQDGKLYHVMLQLSGDGYTAVGIMNRDSGASEETVETIGGGRKWSVKDLNTAVELADGGERHYKFNDWDPVLHRRGFHAIIDHFIQTVKEGGQPLQSTRDALETHRVCEEIVKELEKQGVSAWG